VSARKDRIENKGVTAGLVGRVDGWGSMHLLSLTGALRVRPGVGVEFEMTKRGVAGAARVRRLLDGSRGESCDAA
jgi:hypothetical protein